MTPEALLRESLKALELEVAEEAIPRLLWLLEELRRWNRRVNLTAIAEPAQGVEKHLVDSLTLLPLIADARRLLDIGSGAGFPALPLKIARPDLEVVAVEAIGKKVAFQRHVARALGLEGFRAVQERIENLPGEEDWRRGFDHVVARAVATLAELVEWALPCLGVGGRLIAMKGPEGREELAREEEKVAGLGFVVAGVRDVVLPQSRSRRQLLVLMKKGA